MILKFLELFNVHAVCLCVLRCTLCHYHFNAFYFISQIKQNIVETHSQRSSCAFLQRVFSSIGLFPQYFCTSCRDFFDPIFCFLHSVGKCVCGCVCVCVCMPSALFSAILFYANANRLSLCDKCHGNTIPNGIHNAAEKYEFETKRNAFERSNFPIMMNVIIDVLCIMWTMRIANVY